MSRVRERCAIVKRCCVIILRIVAFLLVGAIVNVAVAWETARSSAALVEFPGSYSPGAGPFTGHVTDHFQGWPASSLANDINPVIIHGYELGTRPIWPGFAINTVFYAFLLWLIFAVPFALRRRWRVKRGLCVKCAYDLRGRAPMSEVCPECGWGAKRTP